MERRKFTTCFLKCALFREGFSAILHIHTAVEEVTIEKLMGKLNKKTKKLERFSGAKFLKQGDIGLCRFKLDNVIAMDKESACKFIRMPFFAWVGCRR